MTLSLENTGFDYVAYYNGAYENADSLVSLDQTGANSIEASLDYGIDPQTDTVYADSSYTDSLSALAATIKQAVGLGLSAMVRPLIDFVDPSDLTGTAYSVDEWRTYFNPGAAGSASANAFFASYQTMILQEAQVAAANGATSLCIGTELDQITGPAYKSYWDSIIGALRADYPTLKLIYAADWDDDLSPWQWGGTGLAAGTGNLATQVSFASELDSIGVDCYAPISDAANPTLTELIAGWTQTPTDATSLAVTGGQSLIAYFESVAAAVGKPLVFTELGYENATDAASQPAGSSTNVVDSSLQANLYQAFFEAWRQAGNSSLTGVYFWNWDPNAAEVGPGEGVNFSPQGLPAQGVATDWFGPGPTVSIANAGGLTNQASQTISGSVSDAGGYAVGTTVTVHDGATAIGTATVGLDGSWSTSVTFANEGANALTATDTDGVGNTGTSAPIVYALDTTPPTLAIASTGGLTDQTTQTISGTIDAADAGLTVSIYDGSTLLGTVTPAANGNWSTSITLPSTQGAQQITAEATDAAGNVGTSNAVTYTLDTIAPVLTITNTGGLTNQIGQTISGTIDPADHGLMVSIYDGTTLLGTVTPAANGNWSTGVVLLATPGAQAITAQATDAAGNVGTSSSVNFTLNIVSTATLTSLASFNWTNGYAPEGSLIADAAGDLFGTTISGGANNDGTVYEIAKTPAGYASTPTTLVSFANTNGARPFGGLIADAAGNLYGTTSVGGTNNGGTVFEIAKTSTGYASTPTTLVNFSGGNLTGPETGPEGGLIADAAGNLYGTTCGGGTNNGGTVFEIAKTSTGYASTPTTLATFSSSLGWAGLIADAAGDLFGTTCGGGANGDGTVFEIAKTPTGYASTTVSLVSFNRTNGSDPGYGALIADAAGDLFGTTESGGANNDGTVFEIAKTSTGYASTPTVLLNLNSINGTESGLVADAAGNLYGTTYEGGLVGGGTVFEIAKTSTGYASSPTTLVTFYGANGDAPIGSLIIGADGHLYGTTESGGANNDGTVFELSGPILTITGKGGLTNQTTQTITGTIDTADAGLTVSIYDGATLLGTAAPAANGDWSASVTLLSTQGAQTITAQATDAAGNVGTSNSVTYTLDTIAPTLAITSGGGLTNKTAQTISGTIDAADAGLTVSIYDGATLIGSAKPAANGDWSASVALLSTQGAQAITAQATDAAGNVGTSSSVTYTLVSSADVISEAVPGTTVTAVAGASTPISGVSVTDAGAGSDTFSTVVSTANGGVVSASGAGGAAVSNSGTHSLTIEGTLAQVDSALATLVYSNANAGSDTVTVTTSDPNATPNSVSKTFTVSTTASQPPHPNDLTYSSTASGYNHFIDLLNFEASFADLIAAFGTNQWAMQNWYA
ncbi:MAG: choice-of-anchor tandem repeat GloVer-containing protein, partial [Roseiarcus sp.]